MHKATIYEDFSGLKRRVRTLGTTVLYKYTEMHVPAGTRKPFSMHCIFIISTNKSSLKLNKYKNIFT